MPDKPTKATEYVNPKGKPGPCVNCGRDIGEHRQDILEDPTRFACPIDGIDWGSLLGESGSD